MFLLSKKSFVVHKIPFSLGPAQWSQPFSGWSKTRGAFAKNCPDDTALPSGGVPGGSSTEIGSFRMVPQDLRFPSDRKLIIGVLSPLIVRMISGGGRGNVLDPADNTLLNNQWVMFIWDHRHYGTAWEADTSGVLHIRNPPCLRRFWNKGGFLTRHFFCPLPRSGKFWGLLTEIPLEKAFSSVKTI